MKSRRTFLPSVILGRAKTDETNFATVFETYHTALLKLLQLRNDRGIVPGAIVSFKGKTGEIVTGIIAPGMHPLWNTVSVTVVPVAVSESLVVRQFFMDCTLVKAPSHPERGGECEYVFRDIRFDKNGYPLQAILL